MRVCFVGDIVGYAGRRAFTTVMPGFLKKDGEGEPEPYPEGDGKGDDGIMIARTRRYPVVHHCTNAVPMPNSRIRVGNVTFIDVSTTMPVKVMSADARIEQINFISNFRSNSISMITDVPGSFIAARQQNLLRFVSGQR